MISNIFKQNVGLHLTFKKVLSGIFEKCSAAIKKKLRAIPVKHKYGGKKAL